jgi:hypothetical protein
MPSEKFTSYSLLLAEEVAHEKVAVVLDDWE